MYTAINYYYKWATTANHSKIRLANNHGWLTLNIASTWHKFSCFSLLIFTLSPSARNSKNPITCTQCNSVMILVYFFHQIYTHCGPFIIFNFSLYNYVYVSTLTLPREKLYWYSLPLTSMHGSKTLFICSLLSLYEFFQCFDAVGLAAGKATGL